MQMKKKNTSWKQALLCSIPLKRAVHNSIKMRKGKWGGNTGIWACYLQIKESCWFTFRVGWTQWPFLWLYLIGATWNKWKCKPLRRVLKRGRRVATAEAGFGNFPKVFLRLTLMMSAESVDVKEDTSPAVSNILGEVRLHNVRKTWDFCHYNVGY